MQMQGNLLQTGNSPVLRDLRTTYLSVLMAFPLAGSEGNLQALRAAVQRAQNFVPAKTDASLLRSSPHYPGRGLTASDFLTQQQRTGISAEDQAVTP